MSPRAGADALKESVAQQRLFNQAHACRGSPSANRRARVGRNEDGRQANFAVAQAGEQIQPVHSGQMIVGHNTAALRHVLFVKQIGACRVCPDGESFDLQCEFQ